MHDFLVAEYQNQKFVSLGYMLKANESFELFNIPSLTECSLSCGNTVGDTAVAFAETPELSTHFLGRKAKAS